MFRTRSTKLLLLMIQTLKADLARALAPLAKRSSHTTFQVLAPPLDQQVLIEYAET